MGNLKLGINGFGRIGRILARLLIEKAGSGDGLRLKLLVVAFSVAKLVRDDVCLEDS